MLGSDSLDGEEFEGVEVQGEGYVWDDLLLALQLLRKGATTSDPFHCEHDVLTVTANPEAFTRDELAQLDEWGFFVEDDCFQSFRFGNA